MILPMAARLLKWIMHSDHMDPTNSPQCIHLTFHRTARKVLYSIRKPPLKVATFARSSRQPLSYPSTWKIFTSRQTNTELDTNTMRRGDEYSGYDDGRLNQIHERAFEYYRRQGCSMLEAYDLATEAVEDKTGYKPEQKKLRRDRENAYLIDRAEEIKERSAVSGRPCQTASSRRDEYDDWRRTQQPSSRKAQPSQQTEYDRMFQNGTDRFASRTSGKILSVDEVEECAKAVFNDLVTEGKSPDFARQKAEQFFLREHSKRNAKMREAGYRFKGDDEDEEDNATPRRNMRRSTGRKYPDEEEYVDDDNDYDTRGSRSGYDSRSAEPKETYDTSYPYSDEDLKLMRRKIYEDWCEKGCDPDEAKREAEKWYNSKMKARRGGESSRRSGFDGFNDIRDALDDEDDYTRQKSRSSRGTRSGKAGKTGKSRPPGWEDPMFDKYFTDEPEDGYRPRSKTGGNSRGYRTEERYPSGGYSSDGYGSYNQPGGVKPAIDLYKLLGVSKHATVAEITKAHKKLCMKYHPDRVSGGAAAIKATTEKMAQINQARDVLKDDEMRAYYNRTGLIASMGESPDA